ncbi:ester cyclase [Paludibacterium purpuratum]|uniref:SnoaL-like polyketide cyclase n=1 Tax=Paludibacterium purpuratum TaxID=1144873 RepID=A0A4R7BD54_9NEIS|nr:ester cyclase [Paludibacterium purpuratum]TDR81567.1 SnoaL-like polyketide cyclase [Paludibacterium purpuratum]
MILEESDMGVESNKEIVRRFNREVIEQGSRSAFDALVDADFVNHSAAPGTPNDAESLWHTFEHVLRPALGGLSVQIHEQLCDGDKVTTRKRVTGKHTGSLLGIAATGLPVTIEVIDIVRIRDGRYIEHWGINTLPSVLAQLRAGQMPEK